MKTKNLITLVSLTALGMFLVLPTAFAGKAAQLDRDANAALEKLYANSSQAKELGSKAKGVLVFPRIVKGGFLIGGQGGEGALIVNGETEAYYSSAAVSYGLQAGVQKFGYALILMGDADLEHVRNTKGCGSKFFTASWRRPFASKLHVSLQRSRLKCNTPRQSQNDRHHLV